MFTSRSLLAIAVLIAAFASVSLAQISAVRINEVESQGGTPGDWVELTNQGFIPMDISGWKLLDNDDTRMPYVFPSGSVIPVGGYLVVEEATLGFSLGAADSVRLYHAAGNLIDDYAWVTHATTTYGRCPDGYGNFATTTNPTKGAANDCSSPVKINEIESDNGVAGDWVELYNSGASAVDVSGFALTDTGNAHVYVIPAGTTIAAGGYLVLDEATFGFGLGKSDTARLYTPLGVLNDSYSWTAHAATTYGRCPNGTGPFATTLQPTKGAANACASAPSPVKINEIESSGGAPGDWVEIYNSGPSIADVSGFVLKDNDDTHIYTIPAGVTIQAGGYLVLDEAQFNFALGAADSARLFDSNGTLIDSYEWTAHAATTYGRCPNGTGAFTTTTTVTKGAPNNCASPVKINEVESNGGSPGDWVELFNPGAAPADVSGFVFKDDDDAHGYVISVGTIIPPGGYLVLDEAAFAFGLGPADSARLFDTSGNLVDTYTWTSHAANTYGRCPNGAGPFIDTAAPTKGTANACSFGPPFEPWPGGSNVQTVDGSRVYTGLSGLAYEGSAANAILWAVRNSPGTLFRLRFNGIIWKPDTTNNWTAGKTLRYPDGTGAPDSEGVTLVNGNAANGIYVSSERNDNASSISRNSVLRFDPLTPGSTLIATHEWNLTADLPATGANAGAEAVTWISDSYLTSRGFFDESKNRAYSPADYPNHGSGLFFVGLEANGTIYAYALDHSGNGAFTRIATITTGLAGVMDLALDNVLDQLWAVCDNTCQGRSVALRINESGRFTVVAGYQRPAGMPNLNNEGFAVTGSADCVANRRPVFWGDDEETGGHSIRQGTMNCSVAPALK